MGSASKPSRPLLTVQFDVRFFKVKMPVAAVMTLRLDALAGVGITTLPAEWPKALIQINGALAAFINITANFVRD